MESESDSEEWSRWMMRLVRGSWVLTRCDTPRILRWKRFVRVRVWEERKHAASRMQVEDTGGSYVVPPRTTIVRHTGTGWR